MRPAWILVATLGACGATPEPAPAAESVPASDAADPLPSGDPLLASARRSVDHGRVADDPRAQLLASTAPQHARAKALLTALDDGRTPPAEPPPSPAAVPTPAVPTVAVASPTPDAPAPAVVAKPPKVRPTVDKLSLRTTARGAALSIHAGSGVLVGVANQPETGVVRLVLDDVAAGAKVLGARPEVEGARVRAVEAGPRSVRITLQLDPGWRFSGVHRTSTGARVDLVGP